MSNYNQDNRSYKAIKNALFQKVHRSSKQHKPFTLSLRKDPTVTYT
jgi:hypothetical protein